MKKYLILLLMSLMTLSVFADTYKYKATNFAYKIKNDYGRWTDWSDWERSSVLIVISLDRETINVYSDTPQEYDIYDYGENWERDNDGGETWTLKCVNADGLRCEIRLRKQRDGQLQMYVDFSDAMWVYSIEQK